jgi:NADH-quinone oxidoreductase subunit L
MGGSGWLVTEWMGPVFAAGHDAHGATHGGGHGPDSLALTLALVSTLVALTGLTLGYLVYSRRPELVARARDWLGGLPNRVLSNKYFVDEFYGRVLYRPLAWLADVVCFRWVDRGVIDGLMVSGSAVLALLTGSLLRLLQNGMVRFYAWVFAVGVTAFTVYLTLLD